MDDRTDSQTPGDQELERRLEAYADARLSPSLDTTTRMRAAVMAAAHRQAALSAADAAAGAADTTTTARTTGAPTRGVWQVWRRALVAVVVGCLAVGILAGSALATRAGGPLYAARLWAEMATLPTDLPARAEAEAKRLQARIEEAQEASTAGDPGATEAALVAYSTIVVEAAKDSAVDATARTTIEASVELHVTVLTTLVASAPASAREAAQHALTQSTDTLRDLKSPGGSVDDHGSRANAGRGNGAQGSKRDPNDPGNASGAAHGCAPSAEPSDDVVAALSGDGAGCDRAISDPDPGTTEASHGKGPKPDPTAPAADKTPPPGHRGTNGAGRSGHQPGNPHQDGSQDPVGNGNGSGTGNGNGNGSPPCKTHGQDPKPCDPQPGP